MDGLRTEGQRVRLRPAREDDLPLIEGLLAGGPAGETLVIAPRGEDKPIGVLQYRMNEPSKGWATIDYLAVVEGSRRWGLGQDAVRLLEDDLAQQEDVRHFRTTIDTGQGLALYFWLRLGYRPLDSIPDSQGRDVMPMVREAAGG